MSTHHRNTRRRWSFQLATTIWTGLLLGGWLLAARAAAGQLVQSLEPVLAWAATVSMAISGLVAAALFRYSRPGITSIRTPLVITLTLAPTLTTGFILLDLSAATAWTGLSAIALATMLAVWVGSRRPRQRASDIASCPQVVAPGPAADQRPPDLSQTLRRHRDPTGDRLDGDLTMHWQSGQRQQPIHVPFVPAFASRPDVSCTCDEDGSSEGVRARVAEVQRFGTRIELRRSGNVDLQQTTRLELSVFLDDADRQAA